MRSDAGLSSNRAESPAAPARRSPPSFGRVRAAARGLLLERDGAERDRDAVGALALELLDALPEGAEDACWRKMRRDCDRLNRYLLEGRAPSQAPRRSPRSDSVGEIRRLRPQTDPLRAIPLAVAFEVLAGEVVPRSGGMVRCPSPDHEDRSPSFRVGDELFHCFGCGRGGSVVDLGGLVWEIEPRGAGYVEICRRLEAELLPALRSAA
jgi:hypothetical protein